MILLAILLATQAFCQKPEVLREEDSVLEVAHADFHAYDKWHELSELVMLQRLQEQTITAKR